MSTNDRSRGLALLALGTTVFAGTTNHMLPAIAFWPASFVCAIGVVLFMKGNRAALEQAETETRRALNPPVRSPNSEQHAEQQAHTNGCVLQALESRAARSAATLSTETNQVAENEIVLYEVNSADVQEKAADAEDNDGFVVTRDVSFPLEVQEQTSLADQLEKLQKLRRDGIISPEEFAIAKAKLLA